MKAYMILLRSDLLSPTRRLSLQMKNMLVEHLVTVFRLGVLLISKQAYYKELLLLFN
jgi:hypothetical protein